MTEPTTPKSMTKAELIREVERLRADLSRNNVFAGDTAASLMTKNGSALTNQSFEAILERSEDGIVVYDNEDVLVFFNRAYLNMIPESMAKILAPGLTFEDVVRGVVNAGFVTAALGREEDYIQDRLKIHRHRKDVPPHLFGDGRWFTSSEHVMPGGGWLLIRRDVTDWITTTRALEKNEERFRDFAEASQDWFWEMDADLRFSYFSDRFYWSSGVRPEQLLGRTRRDSLWDNPEEEPWKSHIEDLEAHRPFRDFVHPRRRSDGEMNYLSISGKPIFDEDGTFQGYRGTGRNITSQWQAEQELARARDLAERANRAKTDFLANMSHELRTPLNSIIGYSEVIAEKTFGPIDNARYAEYIELIRTSGRHLMRLIDDVLDISIIESGNMAIDEEAFDLAEEVSNCVGLMKEQAEKEQIRMISNLALVPKFIGDQVRIRQVILNLLTNAIKFTASSARKGSVGKIFVELARESDGGLSIAIEDNGIGIEQEDMAKVVAPFGQAQSAFVRSHKGAGLGLSIVKNLTELHDGKMSLESESGIGTQVRLTFPASRLSSE